MGKARRKVAEVEFGEHAADLNEQLSPRTGARRSVGSTFEDDASTPRLCVGEIVDGVVANQIHSQKERLGHYWAGALVMQLVLYTVVYSCYSKDAVTDGRAGNATSLLVQDAISDGNDGAGVEQGPPPGELLVQFMTFMCVAYQVREIPKHIAAGKDNEAEWLESDRLADKLKAIKRLQWHQRMCFVPQPLMVMGALIASMGAAMLLSKYADCERGIMAGLAVLDATGMALLIMVVGSISIVIACFWMTTRIHFASYKYRSRGRRRRRCGVRMRPRTRPRARAAARTEETAEIDRTPRLQREGGRRARADRGGRRRPHQYTSVSV
jgi:hypothetical protein